MKLLSAILFCLCFTGIAKAQEITLNPTDQNGINQALQNGGTIYLNPGVYDITGPINLPANTCLTGDSNAVIQVSSSSSQWFTGDTGIITCNDPQNIEVSNIQINGNLENLPHSYNSNDQDPHDCERAIFIIGGTTERGNNITITNMKIYDTFCDGVHVRFCDNVHVSNLEESDTQHEGVYFCEDFNSEISDCNIAGVTSDCLRVENCKNVLVYDNLLYSYSGTNNNGAYEHGESGLQVGNQGRSFGTGSPKPDSIQDIEIYNNTFANNGLEAIAADPVALESASNVYIHNNQFIGKAQLATMGVPVDVGNVSYTNPPTMAQSEQVFSSIFSILNENFYSQVGLNYSVILPDGVKTIPTEATGTIEYVTVGQTSYTLVNLPIDGLSAVQYVVNGSTITHTLMIGEITANGIKFTQTSIWTGADSNDGDSLKLDGKIPVSDIQVKCITPRGSFVPTFEPTSIDNQSISVHPAIFFLFGIVIIGIVAGKMILKSIYS